MATNVSNIDALTGIGLVKYLNFVSPTSPTYTITGGPDAALFSIGKNDPTSNSIFLLFKNAPDFNSPADVGSDNTYDVEVTVSEGSNLTVTLYKIRIVADDFAASPNTLGVIDAITGTATGVINLQGDRDWFRIDSQGGGYRIVGFGVYDYKIRSSTGADMSGWSVSGPTPQYKTLPQGTYYLDVTGDAGSSYSLSVVPSSPYLSGGAGEDTYSGSQIGDLVYGNGGDDSIDGLAGADWLDGGTGNDTLDGGDGLDYLRGGDGKDQIFGGADFDDINGNQGSDSCSGGPGDDWVVGGKDNDSLSGDAGFDLVYGNLGNDTCSGGEGVDWVRGGQGDDSISGGAGNDVLYGDRGDDTIAGGSGADLFRSFSAAGIDRIIDFNYSEGDRVQLDPGSTYTISQSGADTMVIIGGDARLILVGVSYNTLASDWIAVL